jgi:hypothetical protein
MLGLAASKQGYRPIGQHFAFIAGSCGCDHSARIYFAGADIALSRRAEMRSWVLAAGLLAAAALVPTGAYAADVGDDDDGGAYTDPRRKTQPPAAPGYNDRYDDEDDDDRPAPKNFSGPPPPAYAPPGNKYSNQNCARSGEVRQRLTGMGWQDFHDGHQEGDMVVMKARRPNGREFQLTLARCSGQIVEVRPLDGSPYGGGPYAFNRPYRYEDRPYGYDRRWRNDPPPYPYGYGGPRRWWWYGD